MSAREDELDDIDFYEPDDEAHIGSILVLREDCEVTSKMTLIELMRRGVEEIIKDMEAPCASPAPEDCQEMIDFAQEAFDSGRPVTLSLTLMPEAVMRAAEDAEEARMANKLGDDDHLLN